MNHSGRIREVERYLKAWYKVCKSIEDAERDAVSIAFAGGSGAGVQTSGTSDKTYKAVEKLEKVALNKRWVTGIQQAINEMAVLDPDKVELICGHYSLNQKNGYSGDRAATFRERYCRKHYISTATYYTERREAVTEIVDICSDFGLFRNSNNNSQKNLLT